jgi:hypothetical protein
MKKSSFIAAAALLIAGCGADSQKQIQELSSGWTEQTPGHAPNAAPTWSYTAGSIQCPNADQWINFTDTGDGIPVVVCRWRCVTFDGQANENVFFSWTKDSSDPNGWRQTEDTHGPGDGC